jgi:hypothetical protein
MIPASKNSAKKNSREVWKIIIETLRNAGWNCGSMTTTDGKGRSILVVAAEREDAGRFIVNSDQQMPAFLELQSAIRQQSRQSRSRRTR